MSRDLTFLEFRDDDNEDIRDLKSYWHIAMGMLAPERRVFFQQEQVNAEEYALKFMFDQNNLDDEFVRMAVYQAKAAMVDYDMHKDSSLIAQAEAWTEAAQQTRAQRHTIADIRKQREKVQWEKRKLKMMLPPDEPSQS